VEIIPSGAKGISGCRAKPVSGVFNKIVGRAANGSAVVRVTFFFTLSFICSILAMHLAACVYQIPININLNNNTFFCSCVFKIFSILNETESEKSRCYPVPIAVFHLDISALGEDE
jgi:hypothetical protein